MTRSRFGGLIITLILLGSCGSDPNGRTLSESQTDDRPTVEGSDRRSVGEPGADAPPEVLSGADVAALDGFSSMTGARVGLITHSASTVAGTHVADLISADPDIELAALFGPEHGIRSDVGAGIDVADSIDPATGVPVFSLYGERRAPTADLIQGLDVLVYDLQDVGARYYTYISTMGLAMQVAADAGVRFVVLDRPNPHGTLVAGTVLEPGFESFVGQYPIAELYGLTAGELATAIVGEAWLPGLEDLELEVVELSGWRGNAVDPQLERDWSPPSPAIVDSETALVYPATVLFEATSLSFGRGTDLPYRLVGSPELDVDEIVAEMNDVGLGGVEFGTATVTPRASPDPLVDHAFAGQVVRAVTVSVTDPATFRPTEVGVHLLTAVVARNGPEVITRPEWLDLLTGSTEMRTALESGDPADRILAERRDRLDTFEAIVAPYRRYPSG